MTTNDTIRLLQKSGTKISKDKLLEVVKRQRDKDVAFIEDRTSGYLVVLLKVI